MQNTATAAHRRYLSSPAAGTLHPKTQGFVLRLPPNTSHMQHSCSHHNAFCSITWLTCMYLRTAQQSMTTKSYSHSTAICNQRFNKRIEVRTNEQPLVAEHRGGTDYAPQLQPPRKEGNFHHRLQPLSATLHGKTQGFVLRLSSPKHAPCNIDAAITMRFAVSHHPSLSVFLCDAKSHTSLHQVKGIRNSEDCFPTSFDNHLNSCYPVTKEHHFLKNSGHFRCVKRFRETGVASR